LRLVGPAKELVGTDQFGNKYYRVPRHESRAGTHRGRGGGCRRARGSRAPAWPLSRPPLSAAGRAAGRRLITNYSNAKDTWIRKKREDPPTIEEILRNENYREEMKQKVKDVSEKDKLLQAKEYEQGLIAEPSHTQVKGHASAPYYGKKEPSQDPTSTANTFQPGAWMPPGSGSNQNK
ncbi:NDUF2 factor, partial [Oenanthe oenanthe]|nr:NDUF2 factor [Oenanthe oenanthe]